MNRIIVIWSMLLCSLLLNALTGGVMAQTTPEIAKGNCDSCANFCAKTLNYCVKKRGNFGKASVTNALKDCITACKSASEFIARNSTYQKKAAALAVETCNECIKACGGTEVSSDVNMKACADECRKCAGNLEKVAKAE